MREARCRSRPGLYIAIHGYINLTYTEVGNADDAGAIICLPQTPDINDLRQ